MNTVIYENKLYNKIDNHLFTTYQELETHSSDKLIPVFKGKKIPRNMWKEILSFMKQSYVKFKSETLVYLFYDEKSNNPWSWWIPPQTTRGMAVQSDPDNPQYKLQRKNYPDIMFGTVHHHCSTSAFQSGTDELDEITREGIHFTIGNMDKTSDFDIHCRITIGNCHAEIPAETYIEMAENPFKKTANIPNNVQLDIQTYLHKKDIVTLPENYEKLVFQMDNVKKQQSFLGSQKYRGQLGLSYGESYSYGSQYSFLDNEEDMLLKKKKELTELDEAEELIDLILEDYEYEAMLNDYYDHINDLASSHRLYHSTKDSADIAKDLFDMYEHKKFLKTKKGKKAMELTKKFLQEISSSSGLDKTIEDLKFMLQQYSYCGGDEDRTEFQPMDKEDVFRCL